MPILGLGSLDWVEWFCIGMKRISRATFILETGAYEVLGLELLKLGHMMFKIGSLELLRFGHIEVKNRLGLGGEN